MLFNALAALGHRGIKTTATFGRAGLMLIQRRCRQTRVSQARAAAGSSTL